jgi:hypothetical protein
MSREIMNIKDLTNALCLALICTLIGMFVLTGCVAQSNAERELQSLFQTTVQATGNEYVAARRRLLATLGAEKFLKEIQASSKTPDTRWLAEILLARLLQPKEYRDREQEFLRKVYVYYCEFPDNSHAKTNHPQHWGGLLIPEDPIPGDDRTESRYWAPIKRLEKNRAAFIRDYWESLRVQKSSLWSCLCGEIILRGSAAVIQDQPTDLPTCTNQQYVSQVFELLGKLGERRVAPHALKVLQDDEQDPSFRATAVICLGRLKYQECLPQLLEICETDEVTPGLYQIVCEVVTRIASEIDSSATVTRLSQIELQLKQKQEARAKSSIHIPAEGAEATYGKVPYLLMDPRRSTFFSLMAVQQALQRLRQRNGLGK